MLHVPIFQGFQVSAQVEALEAEARALKRSAETVRLAITLEVRQALAQVRAADEAVRASQKGVEAGRLNFETIRERYNTGLSSIIEITDARTAYIAALSAALRANYGARFASAALRLALGDMGQLGINGETGKTGATAGRRHQSLSQTPCQSGASNQEQLQGVRQGFGAGFDDV